MAANRRSSLCLARGLCRAFLKHPPNHHYDTHRLRLLSCYSTKILSSQQNPQSHFLQSCLYSSQTHSLANTNTFNFSYPRSFFTNASSQINRSEFTEMAWKGIIGAGDVARISKQRVHSAHLMKALLEQKDGLAPRILSKAGLDNTSVLQATDDFIYKQRKVIGGLIFWGLKVETSGLVMGPDLNVLLSSARNHKREMKDDFVSVEHLLLAFLSDKRFGQQLFRNLHLSEQTLKDAVKAVRGNQRVTDQNPEGKYDVLDKYGIDLTELARRGKLDPVIGRDDEIRRCIQILSRRKKKPSYHWRAWSWKNCYSRRVSSKDFLWGCS